MLNKFSSDWALAQVYDAAKAVKIREELRAEDDVFGELQVYDGLLAYPATLGFWLPGVGYVFTSENNFLSNLVPKYKKLTKAFPGVKVTMHWVTERGILPAFGYEGF